MTHDNKPREFWIVKDTPLDTCKDAHVYSWNPLWAKNSIHVREVLPNEASEIEEIKALVRDTKAAELWQNEWALKENEYLDAQTEIERLKKEVSDLQDKLYHESRRAPEVEYKLGHEIETLRKQLEVAVEALQGITLPSHTKYSNSDTEFHNRLAYKTLDEIERLGRGSE